MKLKITSCWLLLALGTAAALAQTHPRKKYSRGHSVVKKPVSHALYYPPTYPPIAFCEIDDGTEAKPSIVPFDSTHVYTYVEQMPTLNGQPFAAASRAAIEQRLVVPPAAPTGRVFVGFEVTRAGIVRNVRIVKGLRADVDSAVVTATRLLPRFVPGKQAGHTVVVRTVVLITIPVAKQP